MLLGRRCRSFFRAFSGPLLRSGAVLVIYTGEGLRAVLGALRAFWCDPCILVRSGAGPVLCIPEAVHPCDLVPLLRSCCPYTLPGIVAGYLCGCAAAGVPVWSWCVLVRSTAARPCILL